MERVAASEGLRLEGPDCSPKRNGEDSWVMMGVSGGGGEPRLPAVVEVEVMRLGGGQYC